SRGRTRQTASRDHPSPCHPAPAELRRPPPHRFATPGAAVAIHLVLLPGTSRSRRRSTSRPGIGETRAVHRALCRTWIPPLIGALIILQQHTLANMLRGPGPQKAAVALAPETRLSV